MIHARLEANRLRREGNEKLCAAHRWAAATTAKLAAAQPESTYFSYLS